MIDPKKALATRDGDDLEEGGEGQLLLVDLATGPGTTPDQLAAQMQWAQLGKEFFLGAPLLAFIFGQLLYGRAATINFEWILAIYAAFVWPVLGLSLAWTPLRATHRRWLPSDRLFVGAAFAQAFVVGLAVHACLQLVFRVLFSGSYDLGKLHAIAELATVVTALVVGFSSLATNLVERELEALPVERLPAPAELAAAESRLDRLAHIRSLTGTGFRASVLWGTGWVPLLAADYFNFPLGSLKIPSLVWAFTLTGFAIHHLVRGLFYQSMAAASLVAFRERHRRLSAAGPDAALVAVPETGMDRSWRETRSASGLVSVVATGLFFPLMLLAAPLIQGVNAAYMVALAVWVAATGYTNLPGFPSEDSASGRPLVNSVLAALPATVVFWLSSWVLSGAISQVIQRPGPLGRLAITLLAIVGLERGAALYAWCHAWLAGRRPRRHTMAEALGTALTLSRRAMIGASASGLGLLLVFRFLHLAGLNPPLPVHQVAAWFPGAIGVVLLMRGHLANAAPLSSKDPAEALPPSPAP